LEDEIEHHQFDVKTLHHDINKTHLETKRTRKVVAELKSLIDRPESDEEIILTDSESEDDPDAKKKSKKKDNRNKRNKRHTRK